MFNLTKTLFIACASIAFTLPAFAEGDCLDLQGYDICSYDAKTVFSTMEVVSEERFNDSPFPLVTLVRQGNFLGQEVKCIAGVGVEEEKDFLTCEFEIEKNNTEAIDLYIQFDQDPLGTGHDLDGEIVELRDWFSGELTGGTRLSTTRRSLGVYKCSGRLDFIDHYRTVDYQASKITCIALLK